MHKLSLEEDERETLCRDVLAEFARGRSFEAALASAVETKGRLSHLERIIRTEEVQLGSDVRRALDERMPCFGVE